MRTRVIRYIFPAFICCCTFLCTSRDAFAQKNAYTDSMFAVMHAMPDDTAKASYIIFWYDSTLWEYNLPEAYNQLKLAARISRENNADTLAYRAYKSMGGYCIRANASDYALQNGKLALEYAEKIGDSTYIATSMAGIAMALSNLGQQEAAIQYYHKTIPVYRKAGKIERVGRMHTFISWAYEGLGELDSAIKYNEMGLAEREQANYPLGMYATGNSLCGMYFRKKNYARVKEIIEKLIYAVDSTYDGPSRAGFALWYGAIHEETGNLDSAYWYYKSYATSAEQSNNAQGKKLAYIKLANLLPKMGRADEAYYYLKEHDHINDSIRDWETKNNNARQKEIYDVESKNAEIEELQEETKQQQMENEQKDKQRLWLISVLCVTTALVFVAFLAYRQKRKSALLLHQQKQIIEEKNHDITDSIQYAKRIQQAILPSLDQIKAALPDSFVFFAPKDIVSGDFFWFSETPSSYYLAVVDCTGHGVPGAMMSMIGYNFLGQIVNEMDIEQPADILNELHRKVIRALNKDLSARAVKDGMDVSLLRIDKRTGKISFSGAVRPVYIVTDGSLSELKGDIYSVGGIKDLEEQSFTQYEIEAAPGSCIYLFSDGYADQFGGPRGKKFKYKQLRELLVVNSNLPMEEQRMAVEQTFHAWRANLEQVDDVCVVGLRV